MFWTDFTIPPQTESLYNMITEPFIKVPKTNGGVSP